MQLRSIKFRMVLAFCCVLLLTVALGLLSIKHLKDFNALSVEVHNQILPITRSLATLDNATSEYRVAEASIIFSSNPAEVIASKKDLKSLEKTILQAQDSYNKIHHETSEAQLYSWFSTHWNQYRSVVSRELTLSRAKHKAQAAALYFNDSRSAYNTTTEAIIGLIRLNTSNAQELSNRLEKAYREALLLIGFAVLITVLLIATTFLYIRNSILSPMLDLAANMHRLASNDTDIEIKNTERQDEIGEMSRSAVVFRSNAINLEQSQQRLTLQASILEDLLEEERRLTALQRNFVSMASHEFRTPLTIIDGHAQRMIKMHDRLEPDDIVQRAGKLRSAVLQMTNLIENLLNSAHLLNGDAEIRFHQDEINLAILLREVCNSQQNIVPEAQILEEFDPQPMLITGDSKLLFLVFSNILSNAIKYSPIGAPIKITARIEAGNVAVCVEDRGIGIPAKDIDKLFERYFRGSNVSSISGTGVGLHLVKIMVEQHSGKIAIKSKEDEGTRIIIHLPLNHPTETG